MPPGKPGSVRLPPLPPLAPPSKMTRVQEVTIQRSPSDHEVQRAFARQDAAVMVRSLISSLTRQEVVRVDACICAVNAFVNVYTKNLTPGTMDPKQIGGRYSQVSALIKAIREEHNLVLDADTDKTLTARQKTGLLIVCEAVAAPLTAMLHTQQ
jgi:hypothetical protein